MRDPLKFDAPIDSPEQQELRRALVAAGFDEEILRNLLWVINAHPRLHAHSQIFCNIATLFGSPVFEEEALSWAGEWQSQVSGWRDICRFIWLNAPSLAKLKALSDDFHVDADRARALGYANHPIRNKGMMRHGLVAGLWSIHHSVTEYPPLPDNVPGRHYWELQAHVLAAHIECRFRLSTREFYETYAGELERPVAPVRTRAVSPALRALSLSDCDALLAQMPAAKSPREFARQFEDHHFLLDELSPEARKAAIGDVRNLKRYFSRFLKVLDGWTPPQSLRRGWGGGGSKARRAGYVQFLGAPKVYVQVVEQDGDDTDGKRIELLNVYIDREVDNDANAMEASGLSPVESLEKAFTLISPEDFRGKFVQAMFRLRAIDMAAQYFPFGYEVLTPTEILHLWEKANARIRTLQVVPRITDDVANGAIVGLLVKICLAYSQPLDVMLEARIAWVPPGGSVYDLNDESVHPTLIFRKRPQEGWEGAEFLGLRLIGIMPDYRTVLPDELEEIDSPYADCFVLPDLFRIGPDLVASFRRNPPAEHKAFGIQRETAARIFREMVGSRHKDRITLKSLAAYLRLRMIHLTGDQSLAWVSFSDASRCNEPRMHYTRYAIIKIQESYRRVAKRLTRITGLLLPVADPPEIVPCDAAAVGARFVLGLPEIRELVAALVDYLTDFRVDRGDPESIAAYHNHYLFYLGLFQTLATATRAPTDPGDLYQFWQAQSDRRGPLTASLSDKTGDYYDKTRLTIISPNLARQFAHFQDHRGHLCRSHSLYPATGTSVQLTAPYFTLSDSGGYLVMEEATNSWFAGMLESLSDYPIPSNFSRATLRTELLRRNCPAQSVDAFLGHFNQGESPFGMLSSLDFHKCWEVLKSHLDDIHKELGLRPIASRLLPYNQRQKEFV